MDSVDCALGLYTTIRNLIYSIRIKCYRRIPKIFPHIPVVDEPLYIIWFYSGRGHCHRRYQQLLYYPVLLKTANGHSSKIFIGWPNNHLCCYYAQLSWVVDFISYTISIINISYLYMVIIIFGSYFGKCNELKYLHWFVLNIRDFTFYLP